MQRLYFDTSFDLTRLLHFFLVIYLFIMILPWPFIPALGLPALLCWNFYLISFILKRIQLIKAMTKIFSRGLQAQEPSVRVCILCMCVCVSEKEGRGSNQNKEAPLCLLT